MDSSDNESSKLPEKPTTFKKLVVKILTPNFREAVTIETADFCEPKENEICIRNKYVGISAADVNVSAGRCFADGGPPFDIGFEGIGKIVSIGPQVTDFSVGENVAYFTNPKSFAEYVCVPAEDSFRIPDSKPEYLALLMSGLAASIGLDKVGKIKEGETVVVVAASGGTGHIAVQWAKAKGCRVIGICSTGKKANVLKTLGCEREIIYVRENVLEVLKKEYPEGVDVIWETMGARMFENVSQNMATNGRLVVAGATTGYKCKSKNFTIDVNIPFLPEYVLTKRAIVQGFSVHDFKEFFAIYFKKLCEKFESGDMKVVLDTGKLYQTKEFVGMEGIIAAEEHLHLGMSIGKVIVKISDD